MEVRPRMMRSFHHCVRGVVLGGALGLLTVSVGCSGTSESDPQATESAVVQTYHVEGILTQLPSAPGRELMIRHVAIPDFVAASGDTVGMNSMTMGFPVADDSLLEGFAPGDSVRFIFEVRWGGEKPLRLTALERLPAGTELEFGKVGAH